MAEYLSVITPGQGFSLGYRSGLRNSSATSFQHLLPRTSEIQTIPLDSSWPYHQITPIWLRGRIQRAPSPWGHPGFLPTKTTYHPHLYQHPLSQFCDRTWPLIPGCLWAYPCQPHLCLNNVYSHFKAQLTCLFLQEVFPS